MSVYSGFLLHVQQRLEATRLAVTTWDDTDGTPPPHARQGVIAAVRHLDAAAERIRAEATRLARELSDGDIVAAALFADSVDTVTRPDLDSEATS